MITTSRTLAVKKIDQLLREKMYKVFNKYYSNVSEQEFNGDLDKKNHAIILFAGKRVIGFSTLVEMNVKHQGKDIVGVFTGDTIVEKEFWGNNKLGTSFANYLYRTKILNPTKSVYWFLISKGYKTYLLLANNFEEHYPRYEQETPQDKKEILSLFANHSYSKFYHEDQGLLIFDKDSCQLKFDIAPITDELKQKNRRIAFFEQKNPNWLQGNELCCIANVSLTAPLKYIVKMMRKKFGLLSPMNARPSAITSKVTVENNIS